MMQSASEVSGQFRTTRLRAGYEAGEVDAFVETVEEALRSLAPRITSEDVAWQRFRTVVLRPGYDRDDVDDYLTEAEHRLGELERWGWGAWPSHPA
jgi:DivIVA domain-containing protein